MDPIDPKFVPQLAQKLGKWNRNFGVNIMPQKAMAGTKFFAPPSLAPLVHTTVAYQVNLDSSRAMRLPGIETIEGYRALAAYYAETFERARCFHLSSEMTNLALRTKMPKYKLTLDMLPTQAPWGFLTWAMPIGQAENNPASNSMVDFRTGEMTKPSRLEEFNPFADVDAPIVGVLWRYEPEAHSVWVAFFAQHDNVLRSAVTSEAEFKKARKIMGPLSLEREQELPLDRILGWCDADPSEGPILPLTAYADLTDLPEHLRAEAMHRNELARTMTSDWVRILVTSWMLMKWKIAHQEVIPPPPSVVREVAKAQKKPKSEVARNYGTTVVRLGAPIEQRGPRKGGKEYTWKVRAIIGPAIRTRQYIPALDIYDEEPRLIEPYIAGPPGAPISNADKVFLLE